MSKLKEAREVVDSLKKKAAQQSQVLAEKQREADESMTEITSTIQVDRCLCLSLEQFGCSLANEAVFRNTRNANYLNLGGVVGVVGGRVARWLSG